MAELDPIIARILLKGDDQLLSALSRVGREGAEHLGSLAEAAGTGAEPLNLFADKILYIGAAISGITAGMVAFIEAQTELAQKSELLAEAFGTTTGQLQQIEQVFASSGVKVEQFERFANRLAITIAREWPQISEQIRNFANESEASHMRVANSILRVQEAQKNLFDHSAERSSQMTKDNLAVEQSYIKLQYAAQHATEAQVAGQNSIRNAALSTEAALMAQREVHGDKPSDSEKQALKGRQADQAVADARAHEAQTRVAEQERQATAQLKQQQDEQAHEDLRRKAAKNARDDADQRKKDENAIKEAVIARGEAEERDTKFNLSNSKSVRDALDGIVDGNKAAATAIDTTQVSVENLKRGIIAQAAEHSKSVDPTPYEVMIALSNTLSKAKKDEITETQQLALVNRFAATSMQAIGGVGAEMLHVLQHNSAELQKLSERAKALDTKEAKKSIDDFRSALSLLNFDLTILSQELGIAAAPAFTAFLNAVRGSLDADNGLLHIFVEGLKGIGAAIGGAIQQIKTFGEMIDKALHAESGTALKAVMFALLGLVAAFSTSWIAIPAAIGLVISAIGYLSTHLDSIKAKIQDNIILFGVTVSAVTGIALALAPIPVAIGIAIAAAVLLYENWDKIKAKIEEFKGALAAAGISVLALISLSNPWMVILGLIAAAVYTIYMNWDRIKDAIGSAKDAALQYFGFITKGEQEARDAARTAAAEKRDALAKAEADKKAAAASSAVDKAVSTATATPDLKTAQSNTDLSSKLEPTARGLDKLAKSADKAADSLTNVSITGKGWDKGRGGDYNGSEGHAEGGMIRGPGTGTSDSIMARLSNGEFVNNARSVAHYGADFFHALNSMTLPGFAMGGLVPSPVRMGGGGSASATSTVNLSIDGRSFGSLRGSKSTVDDLSAFAISRQASAAGSNPSWMK